MLQQACEDHPVVVLTGARQVGKSTLLLNSEPFSTWRYLSLDDFNILEQAQEQPEGLWAGTDRIVLDEVQKAPRLLSAVKLAVDRSPGRCRFVLSGSVNLLLMKQVSETLAGRAVYHILEPLTLGEMMRSGPPEVLQDILNGVWPEEAVTAQPPTAPALLLKGFMPALLGLDNHQAWLRWWEGYISTYLERDLRQISQVDSLLDFRRLMELLALRTAQLLNQSELGRDASISQPTVHRYLNILETTHLFNRLPAYTASHTTRLLKSPKAFWSDPGLAVYLSGYYDLASLQNAREYGAYFETLIYHHLRVLAQLMTPSARLYFWRTRAGSEVDFVFEYGRKVVAIEIKSKTNPVYRDTAGIRAFLDDHPQALGGILLHQGTEVRFLSRNIIALPWTMIA